MEASNVHRVFGSLMAVWIAYLFNQNFPPINDGWGILYLTFLLSILVAIAVSLEVVFNRADQAKRIIGYVYITLGSLFIPFAIYLWITNRLVVGESVDSDFLWRVIFIGFVFVAWFFAAELGNQKVKPSRNNR
ncbi:MAG: hypothetical protein WD751_09995 [Anaerolineales bacterium]